MLQFSFRFFFLFSLFFHSTVIDTMIRNTGRLSIRFRIERNDGVWDNLGRDRESSCKISIKFMRWIDDSRDSSCEVGSQESENDVLGKNGGPRNETGSIVAFQCLRFIAGHISSWLYRRFRISSTPLFLFFVEI